ncbi:MAG: hypothetical protein L0Z70_15750 [Chloroflexi bacterium]|nr:hypothetical protein [Chloroflexota bacterium]
MEAALKNLLPRLLPGYVTWAFHVFQGKRDLLNKLEKRLRGYKAWNQTDYRVVVLIDEDRQNWGN